MPALVGAHPILHVSRVRVNCYVFNRKRVLIRQENLKIWKGQWLKYLHFLLMWRRSVPYKFLLLYNFILLYLISSEVALINIQCKNVLCYGVLCNVDGILVLCHYLITCIGYYKSNIICPHQFIMMKVNYKCFNNCSFYIFTFSCS